VSVPSLGEMLPRTACSLFVDESAYSDRHGGRSQAGEIQGVKIGRVDQAIEALRVTNERSASDAGWAAAVDLKLTYLERRRRPKRERVDYTRG
jgi:hypothetical protein